MEPIKVKDKFTLELSRKLTGYRVLLDNLAILCGTTELEFWMRIRKIYKLDKDTIYVYDHLSKEIKER